MGDISADKNDRLMGNVPVEKRKKGTAKFSPNPFNKV